MSTAGTWAIVNYALAVESDDVALRRKVLNQIVKYNQEDLEATWQSLSGSAVLRPCEHSSEAHTCEAGLFPQQTSIYGSVDLSR